MSNLSKQYAEPSEITIGGKYHVRINEFRNCDWCSIFNTPQFFNIHRNGAAFYFELQVGTPGESVGVAHFTEVEHGYYRSPRRGTFGSFEFRERLRIEIIDGFYDEIERVLAANDAHRIEILEPPAILDPQAAAVRYNMFYRKGYRPQAPELDHALTVDEREFSERIEYNIRKRLNKCKREDIVVKQVDPPLYRQVYDVIVRNRSAKGFPVSMTYEAISTMVEAFPERLVFFGAFSNDTMIASSICINVNSAMLYVFYWGDLPGYETYSPVTVIAESIYRYAQDHGFSLIDLGTSTIGGVPNYGLVNFKREMGCLDSLKLTFVKQMG